MLLALALKEALLRLLALVLRLFWAEGLLVEVELGFPYEPEVDAFSAFGYGLFVLLGEVDVEELGGMSKGGGCACVRSTCCGSGGS